MVNEDEKSARGCFFYGCLSLLVILLVGGGALYFGVKSIGTAWVESNTSTSANVFPKLNPSSAQISELLERVDTFANALGNDEVPEPLVLTEDDLNILIAHHPESLEIQGRIHASIEGDSIGGKISWPLDDFEFPGRFFNASAMFFIRLVDGELILKLKEVALDGAPLSQEWSDKLKDRNLAQEMDPDPEFEEMLKKLESVEVQDSKLILRAKSPQIVV